MRKDPALAAILAVLALAGPAGAQAHHEGLLAHAAAVYPILVAALGVLLYKLRNRK